MFGTNFPNFSTLLSDPNMIDSLNKTKYGCFFPTKTDNLHRKTPPPGFQLKLHSSKGHGHVQNTQHRWKPPGLQHSQKKWTKNPCCDQTKHVSRNISFEIWVKISNKTSLEVRSNQHHSPSLSLLFSNCQFKSSCQCPESKALQRDLCWQSEDILFLSVCKLRFPEGITKPLWP